MVKNGRPMSITAALETLFDTNYTLTGKPCCKYLKENLTRDLVENDVLKAGNLRL
jgi:hypothetical protein